MLALYIIVGLVVFLILLLCIPVETVVKVDTESSKKFSLKVSWLFGIVQKDLGKRRTKQVKKNKILKKKKRSLPRFDINLVSQIPNATGLIKRFKDFIFDIYRQLRIKEISGDLVVGLEDPVHTGMLFAVIGPANALLNLHPRYNVTVRPLFDDENVLEGNLHSNVKVQPIRLVGPALKLITSLEVLRIGHSYIRKKLRIK
ncbi:MAG TPA: DUF2953 domain-containing protein [Dehalococcoidia bacterium]|nr:DUF2953 domain-containing protein [Dehalococcoidia bacterium]